MSLGSGIFKEGESLHTILSSVYKNSSWEPDLFTSRGKSQLILHQVIQTIFRDRTDIHFNYLHPHLVHESTGKPTELDVYIAHLNLAFEYQGIHHYQSHFLFGDFETFQKRDSEKKKACKEAGIYILSLFLTVIIIIIIIIFAYQLEGLTISFNPPTLSIGITLIEVPYWWNYSANDLLATIHQHRPDVIPDKPIHGNPIPDRPTKRVRNIKNKQKPQQEEEDRNNQNQTEYIQQLVTQESTSCHQQRI